MAPLPALAGNSIFAVGKSTHHECRGGFAVPWRQAPRSARPPPANVVNVRVETYPADVTAIIVLILLSALTTAA